MNNATDDNVVPLRKASATLIHPRYLMDEVYAYGAIGLSPTDRTARIVAAMLHTFGMFEIDEVGQDGSMKRVQRGRARISTDATWRVSKPDLDGDGIHGDAVGLLMPANA